MQTLHSLRYFRDLRAVSSGLRPRRRRSPPMWHSTLDREALSALSNSPDPTCAVGWRPEQNRGQGDIRALTGRSLLTVGSVRALGNGRPTSPVTKRICRAMLVRQTVLCLLSPATTWVSNGESTQGPGIYPRPSERACPMPLLFAMPGRPLDARQWTQKAAAAAADDIPRDDLASTACFAISATPLHLSGV